MDMRSSPKDGEVDLNSRNHPDTTQAPRQQPSPVDQVLPRTSLAAAGLSASAVEALLRAMESAGLELHSFMLARHGAVVAEAWWKPYAPQHVHMLHSVTKALTATGIGLAVHEGLFSLDDTVVSFFPERLPTEIPPNLAQMRVRDLLTQTSGHDRGMSGSVWRGIASSWIDEFLKIPVVHAPGTHFQYSSATSFMLSAIVTRTSGQSLRDYLAQRLFEPLGMRSVRWDVGPEGINPGGNGVSASSEDLLRLAILHAADGRWQGRRILPEGWVAAASKATAAGPYGYHWWVWPNTPGFFAFGAFGQYAFVLPEHGLALVTTAAVPGSISRPDVGIPPRVWEYLPRVIAGADATAGTEASLAAYLHTRELKLAAPDHPAASTTIDVDGLCFDAEPNADGIQAIRLDFRGATCRLQFEIGATWHGIEAGLHGTTFGSHTTLPGAGLHHGYEPGELVTVASGHWNSPCSFTVQCQYTETAFRDTFVLVFEGEALTMSRSVNVNGGATSRPLVHATVHGTRNVHP